MAGSNIKTPTTVGNIEVFTLGSGANANDVIFAPGDVSKFDDFCLMSTAGAMQVLVSLDGVNFTTAPLSMLDLGVNGVQPTMVNVTAAGRMYRFGGDFALLQVTQNGAVAVANASLSCRKSGGQF